MGKFMNMIVSNKGAIVKGVIGGVLVTGITIGVKALFGPDEEEQDEAVEGEENNEVNESTDENPSEEQ